jgi:hypothetical protein
MVSAGKNIQLFALRRPPPGRLEVGGGRYRLVRVFKHDFFAATCLYELEAAEKAERGIFPKLVVKFGREQDFCGLPARWLGRLNRRREEGIYRVLQGVSGVPRWAGAVGESGFAIEFVEGVGLDQLATAPAGFFDRLRELFDAVHARGVAYSDANKRSNIIVAPDGKPYLVDYQLSVRRRDDLPLAGSILRILVRRMADKDLYHLYKHKRRMAPHELAPQEEALSRHRSLLHRLHRTLLGPYRALRRGLRNRLGGANLTSPTAHLETAGGAHNRMNHEGHEVEERNSE